MGKSLWRMDSEFFFFFRFVTVFRPFRLKMNRVVSKMEKGVEKGERWEEEWKNIIIMDI